MEIEKIDELAILTLQPFIDERGTYLETYNENLFQKISSVSFVQDDFSKSKRGVFRGLHGDLQTWKLVSCPHGEISIVIINCDPASINFSKCYSFELTGDNYRQILIPPLFANGHYIKSEEAIFSYKQSTYYNEVKQFSINIHSKLIDKKHKNFEIALLSERDSSSGEISNPADLKQYIQNFVKY